MNASEILKVESLSKAFSSRGRPTINALESVEISVREGHITGLVGESGSGKSTLIRCIMGLERPDAGRIIFDGMDMLNASREEWRKFRQDVQMIFQDPYSSLDPRKTVESSVGEGLSIHRSSLSRPERRELVIQALESVGLSSQDLDRYPRSFSGGQRQRIATARAIVMRPRLLICDEPVSALDVSVQAQVINLLKSMQAELNISMLFIAHDLAVVRHLCDTVSVLEHGRIVEHGTTSEIFGHPQAPYTRALIAASPVPDPAIRRAGSALR